MQNVLYPAQGHALKGKGTENKKMGSITRRSLSVRRKRGEKRDTEKQGRYGMACGEEWIERNG